MPHDASRPGLNHLLAPPPAPDLAGPFHTWERGADGGVVPSRTEAFADHHEGLSALMRGPDSPLAKLVAHLAGGPAGLKVSVHPV